MRDKLIGKLRCIEAAILVFFIIHGGIFGAGVNILVKVAEEDMWLSCLIGCILGFIPFYAYISLSNDHPDKNIFEIIESIFGKAIGKFLVLLITLFAISFILFYFWNLTNLISSQYLYNTPQIFIYIIFAIPLIYILAKGIKVALQSIIIIFIITAVIYIITFFSLLPQSNFLNLMPILKDGILPVLEAALGFIAYSITPLLFIGSIPVHYYEDKKNYKKHMTLAYIASCTAVFAIPYLVITIFGIDLAQLYQYPEFQILKRVSIGGFIERIESTLSIQWIFELFVLITIGMYFIKQGIYHVFYIKGKKIKAVLNFIFLVVSIIGSSIIFRNNTIANQFSVKLYPYVCYGVLVFFIILYIFVGLKKKRKS